MHACCWVQTMRRYAGLILLGLSLACKHDLALLPLWLVMATLKGGDYHGFPNQGGRDTTGDAHPIPRGLVLAPMKGGDANETITTRLVAVGAAHPLITRGWCWRLAVLTIPTTIWLSFFIPPALAGGWPSIWRYVFMFRGFANAPLWNMLIPPQVLHVVPPFVLFVTAMCVAGWVATRSR